MVLFFVFIAPDVQRGLGWAPVTVTIALSAFMYTSLLLTGLRDPGIVAREAPLPDEHMCAPRARARIDMAPAAWPG